jgi:hypothetical protein
MLSRMGITTASGRRAASESRLDGITSLSRRRPLIAILASGLFYAWNKSFKWDLNNANTIVARFSFSNVLKQDSVCFVRRGFLYLLEKWMKLTVS